jgi:hypothetical protein
MPIDDPFKESAPTINDPFKDIVDPFADERPRAAERPQGRSIGGFAKQIGEAFEKPAETPEIKTKEELAEQWKDWAKGYGKTAAGMTVGLGAIGDIEALGRMPFKSFGVPQQTFVPTSAEYGYLGPRGTETFEEAKTREEKLGGLASAITTPYALSAVSRLGRAAAIGRPGAVPAEAAKSYESMGVKVGPEQVRAKGPIDRALDPESQKIINNKASEATGEKANVLDENFFRERAKALGKEADSIYKNKFKIDETVADVAKELSDFERVIDPAGQSAISSTGRNIYNRFQEAKKQAEEADVLRVMKGQKKALGEVGEFKVKEFAPGERIDAPPLTPEIMKAYEINNWSKVRPLKGSGVEWAENIESVISDLSDKLGLRVKPGLYVGDSPSGTQGLAGTPGHIVFNERYFKTGEDALSTAVHELGHQFEYQAFRYADPKVKNAIIKAWNDQNKSIPAGAKTVEEYRPVTAEKYDPVTQQYKVMGTSDKYSKYIRSFPEWFAEQVSRWITTKQEPITVVDKFFKGVGDAWKKVYQRVTGYVPLVDEVDQFMRANWDGKLLNEATKREVFVPGEAPKPIPGEPVEAISPTGKPIVAEIEGKELQALRERLSQLSRSASGSARTRLREMIDLIDEAITKTDPKLGAKLAEFNRRYTAFKTLEEGKGSVVINGMVDPKALGRELELRYKHPLYRLGNEGKAINARHMGYEEPATKVDQSGLLSALYGRSARLLGNLPLLGVRSQAARRAQRGMEPPLTNVLPPEPFSLSQRRAAGTLGRIAPPAEEEQ